MRSRENYFTTKDGVRLFFQVTGNGERPLVIPNGFYLRGDFARLAQGRTLGVFDLRNRGKSDAVTDEAKLRAGILNDVDDLEALRHHLGFSQIDLLAHSYVATTVILYARLHPARVRRVVQIGPMPPDAARQYPSQSTATDTLAAEIFAALGELQKQRDATDAVLFCKQAWALLGRIYVMNPSDAGRAQWGRCELANERAFMKYWSQYLLPSIQKIRLDAEAVKGVQAPVLIVHGRQDRSSPYGGGREWARILPHARLLTVENAAHAPWVEAPELVVPAIEVFLRGAWPREAESLKVLARAEGEDHREG